MPEDLSSKGVDTRLEAPSLPASFFANNQFWKRSLNNNDFLGLYYRGGIGWKAVNKICNDLFDNLFETENKEMLSKIDEYNLHDINWFAYKNARISGYCLIYIAYADGREPDQEANTNAPIDYFYVIPRAWVEQDRFHDKQTEDYYKIYKTQGDTTKIHHTRFIRVSRDDNEKSSLEPAYNSLFVCDNVLWSTGQSFFRTAQGFPHITVKDPVQLTVNGSNTDEVELIRNSGILKDINSETGFVSDERINLKFVGAEGVALKPKEYWEVCFTNACIALEIPKALLEGVVAGAVSGSETNLKDYYSDLSSIQKREIQPIYMQQMSLLKVSVKSEDFLWNPLFEESQEQISQNFSQDAQSYEKLILNGVFSAQEVRSVLTKSYDSLKEFENTSAPEVTSVEVTSDQDGRFPKAEFRQNIKFGQRDKFFDKVESKFKRDLLRKYKATRDIIVGLFVGYNTDSSENDAIENNFKPITTRMGKIFVNDKDVYRLIVSKYIDDTFNGSLDFVRKELALKELDFTMPEKIKLSNILKENTFTLTSELLDSVEKDITLFLTDVSLNNIPFTNTGLKKEIQSIFDKKIGRLGTIATTENTRVTGTALEFGYKESGLVTHKQVQAVLDDKTTPICQHLNGEIVEIGQPFSTGDFGEPFHINCRSRIVPLTLSENQLEKFKQ